ncbi:MAG: phytanoyl-CoA dioxygenase family protein [Rickettsiales bacterium]|jgi:ectoine hydroxylase
MTPEDILKHAPRVLSQAQREAYFESGYVSGEGLIPKDWLEALRTASDERIEASRQVTDSGSEFDLAPDHTAAHPHVRRIKSPVDHHPVFRKFAVESPFADIAADLVGPNVKFHSGKINYKHPGGGEIVKWHQDICFWPHTNYSPVTLGVYLDGCDEAMGPLTVIPESHKGDLFEHYDDEGNWTGTVGADDMATVPLDRATGPTGEKGAVLALNCRTIHGSRHNASDKVRPMLLYVYTSADAYPWTIPPTNSTLSGEILRGEQPRYPHIDPRPCPAPPDWTRTGYGSIFTSQEKGDDGGMMG